MACSRIPRAGRAGNPVTPCTALGAPQRACRGSRVSQRVCLASVGTCRPPNRPICSASWTRGGRPGCRWHRARAGRGAQGRSAPLCPGRFLLPLHRLCQPDSQEAGAAREMTAGACQASDLGFVAEREGFEPPGHLHARLLSRQLQSTRLCHRSSRFAAAR